MDTTDVRTAVATEPCVLGLVISLGALAGLQLLHLLDSLRTDPAATFPAVLLSPQAVAGLGIALAAMIGVRRGARWGLPVAQAAALLVSIGFLVVHGVPVASARTEPYWGDGSTDALQWFGVASIWVTSGFVLVFVRRQRLARRRSAPSAVGAAPAGA